MSSRLGVAHHESAHAIVALGAFGHAPGCLAIHADGSGSHWRRRGDQPKKVRYVAVSHDKETSVYKWLAASFGPRDLSWASEDLIVLFAGAAAHARIDGVEVARDAGGVDLERAVALADAVTRSDDDALDLLVESRARAAAYVSQFWPQITAVAHELNRRGRLDGDDVWMLLGGFGPAVRRANGTRG